MATYPNAGVNQFMRRNYLYHYPTNGSYDCQSCWADLIGASEAEYFTNIPYSQYGIVGATWLGTSDPSGRHYRNRRASARFNLAGLNPDNVKVAYLRSQGGRVDTTTYGVSLRMHDGSHLSGDKYDYAEVEDGEFLGGALVLPFELSSTQPWNIRFNAAGLAFLKAKAGGYAWIGFTSDTYSYPPPGCPEITESHQELYVYCDTTKCYITINTEEGGYIWVEGINLCYLDFFRTKRVCEGGLGAGTGVAGHIWVEGDYLHYIDASGNERYLLGSTTGKTGLTAGQLSINYAEGGTKLCYIDATGAERCFEGT